MNGNINHTMSAICDTSSRSVYRELVRDKKILELLFDAEFFVNLIMYISYFGIPALIHWSAKREMCHKCGIVCQIKNRIRR